ncbi:hypothetical protein [uncultured Clostridium sp.]|mgnify:CR=1 FL=1|uniref:hypothetical protein n=1 Tax=uncultured Clostridium sp. TaxID=59620 RepID=UPI0025F64D30|nr:hypothetical protein [uncultured Clostridium sp.]
MKAIKTLLISILTSLNLICPVETIEPATEYPPELQEIIYKIKTHRLPWLHEISVIEEENLIAKTYWNTQGDFVATVENYDKEYFSISYSIGGKEYICHTHSKHDFDSMFKNHQQNLRLDYENMDIENMPSYYVTDSTIAEFAVLRKDCIELLQRTLWKEENNLIEEAEKEAIWAEYEATKERLLTQGGYDWERDIDYYTVYGNDWICAYNEHHEELEKNTNKIRK